VNKTAIRTIGDVLSQVKREVVLDADTTYNLLGVRWYGKGAFVRETKTGREIKAKKLYQVKAGDFIYNRLFAWKASFAIIPEEFDGYLVSNEFPLFECKSGVDPRFVLRYILLPSNIHTVNQLSKGVAGISRKRFKEHLFLNMPLPNVPYNEQLRICNQIDQHSCRIHELDTEIQRQKTILAQLRQAILQEAIQGKLTADWREQHPDVEPASELLKRIAAEKAELVKAKKIRKQKPLPPITDDEIPFEIPETWEWCRLGDIILNSESGKSLRCDAISVTGTAWGIVKTSAITTGVFLENENKYLSNEAPSCLNSRIHEGDLIFCRASGSKGLAGKSAIVRNLTKNLLLSDKTIRVNVPNCIIREYIHIYNSTQTAAQYYSGLNTGKSTSMNNVTRPQLLSLLIACPPSNEQQAIVERVQAQLTICDKLEKEITAAEQHAKHLSAAILQEVFVRQKELTRRAFNHVKN